MTGSSAWEYYSLDVSGSHEHWHLGSTSCRSCKSQTDLKVGDIVQATSKKTKGKTAGSFKFKISSLQINNENHNAISIDDIFATVVPLPAPVRKGWMFYKCKTKEIQTQSVDVGSKASQKSTTNL